MALQTEIDHDDGQPILDMPAQQRQLVNDTPTIDSPPLHDDRHSDHDDESEEKSHGQFLKRHPLLLALGLVSFAAAMAVSYLYWDHSRHFETTDDAFIAARFFAIAPKVAGYITAVPVTDNQHVAASDVIVRIDDRDYRAALDQTRAQLAHDQSLLDQAQRNLGRYQVLGKSNSIAQRQVDDQTYLVEQDKSTGALDQANVDL